MINRIVEFLDIPNVLHQFLHFANLLNSDLLALVVLQQSFDQVLNLLVLFLDLISQFYGLVEELILEVLAKFKHFLFGMVNNG